MAGAASRSACPLPCLHEARYALHAKESRLTSEGRVCDGVTCTVTLGKVGRQARTGKTPHDHVFFVPKFRACFRFDSTPTHTTSDPRFSRRPAIYHLLPLLVSTSCLTLLRESVSSHLATGLGVILELQLTRSFRRAVVQQLYLSSRTSRLVLSRVSLRFSPSTLSVSSRSLHARNVSKC